MFLSGNKKHSRLSLDSIRIKLTFFSASLKEAMLQTRNGAILVLVQVTILSQVSRCKYLGCFISLSTKNVLNGIYVKSSNMTTEMCCSTCASNDWNIYALQYGSYCYCGTHESNYEILGIAPESDCNTHCAGSPSCGGETFRSVYEGETYVGCYKVDSRANTFTFGGPVRDLTIGTCLDRCRNAFRYIGLKQGNKCYCSDILPSPLYIVNNTKCLEEGYKCQGGDRCGGSRKIAVWTNIENLEEDGPEYVGCYKGTAFTFIQRNKQLADCAKLCSVNYLYVGITSDTDCFCGNMLPIEESCVYKTMKLFHGFNGNVGSYRLHVLCNVTNTGYMKVWRLGPRSGTLSPSKATNNEDSIPADLAQDTQKAMTTILHDINKEDVIPCLKVYPFLITSFFLGCITVISVVCLSRSYQSRKVMMQVRKQMAKQEKNNLKVTSEASRNEMTSNANIIGDNTAYSIVNVAGNITPYSIVACSDPGSIHYEEVQKESAVGESASNGQYTKVDRQSVSFSSPSVSNPNEEDYYLVPKKPALPTNPPPNIIKQSKKNQIPKGKSKEGKGKTASRPTYAPPGVHKIKAMTSSDGTGATISSYSFCNKSVSHEDQQLVSSQEGKRLKEGQNEFDFQYQNQIRFKKRSMFEENVTKSFIVSQGSDLSSVYPFSNKTDKRPKSASAEVPVNWKNTLDLPGKECKFEQIPEIPTSKIPEAYGGRNEDTFPNLANDVDSEMPRKDQEEANIYRVIKEEKIRKDEIYQIVYKQDSPQNALI